MKQKQNLLDCVSSLKEVRAQLHNALDPSITAKLDGAIGHLEFWLSQETPDEVSVRVARMEALRTVALVIESIVTVADLLRHL